MDGVGLLEEVTDETVLFGMEFDDLVLNRSGCNHAINRYRTRLTDPVRPVRRLSFHGGIPPRVHVNHVVRRRQIETESPRFETDEKDVRVPRLKGVNRLLTLLLRHAAGQNFIGQIQIVQPFGHQIQIIDKLTEDEDFVIVRQKLRYRVGEEVEF